MPVTISVCLLLLVFYSDLGSSSSSSRPVTDRRSNSHNRSNHQNKFLKGRGGDESKSTIDHKYSPMASGPDPGTSFGAKPQEPQEARTMIDIMLFKNKASIKQGTRVLVHCMVSTQSVVQVTIIKNQESDPLNTEGGGALTGNSTLKHRQSGTKGPEKKTVSYSPKYCIPGNLLEFKHALGRHITSQTFDPHFPPLIDCVNRDEVNQMRCFEPLGLTTGLSFYPSARMLQACGNLLTIESASTSNRRLIGIEGNTTWARVLLVETDAKSHWRLIADGVIPKVFFSKVPSELNAPSKGSSIGGSLPHIRIYKAKYDHASIRDHPPTYISLRQGADYWVLMTRLHGGGHYWLEGCAIDSNRWGYMPSKFVDISSAELDGRALVECPLSLDSRPIYFPPTTVELTYKGQEYTMIAYIPEVYAIVISEPSKKTMYIPASKLCKLIKVLEKKHHIGDKFDWPWMPSMYLDLIDLSNAIDQEIPFDVRKVKFLQPLGCGAFGTVILGQIEEQCFAVKVIKLWYTKKCLIELRVMCTMRESKRFRRLLGCTTGEVPSSFQLGDRFTNEKCLFLKMEYVCGINLGAAMTDPQLTFGGLPNSPYLMPLWFIARVASSGLLALHELHLNRTVHRDIKPSNILVGHTSLCIYLIDHSSSCILTEDKKCPYQCGRGSAGTYTSPDCVKGEHCHFGNDIWALGIVLLQMALGERIYTYEELDDGKEAEAGLLEHIGKLTCPDLYDLGMETPTDKDSFSSSSSSSSSGAPAKLDDDHKGRQQQQRQLPKWFDPHLLALLHEMFKPNSCKATALEIVARSDFIKAFTVTYAQPSGTGANGHRPWSTCAKG